MSHGIRLLLPIGDGQWKTTCRACRRTRSAVIIGTKIECRLWWDRHIAKPDHIKWAEIYASPRAKYDRQTDRILDETVDFDQWIERAVERGRLTTGS